MLRNERGQVAILFALVFTFMFILFAFVVDFGHLINNKINLQIAADSAAYAGAAQQANLLNRIAAINYRIRQDFKELAMRVQVTHVRHNRNFPRGNQFINGGNDLARGFYPFVCQQAHGYVANSGLRYAQNTNLCRNASPEFGGLPPIVVPPVIAAFDPFAVAIAQQIRTIQQKANQECRAAAGDNRRLVEHLKSVYEIRSAFHVNQMKEMESFMNELGQVGNPAASDNIMAKTAYESARRNLTLANRDDFRFEILQPAGGEYIQLSDNKTRASLFFYDFNVIGDGCVGKPAFLDDVSLSVGMTKKRETITYFAVKLTSKPKMLFMPEAWIEAAFPTLTAVAAAKPFGGRIGPQPSTDQLLPTPNRPGNNNRMINFSLRPNDQFGIMNTKIMSYLDALHPYNGASRPDGNQNTGWPEPDKPENNRQALQAIRAPTIFDAIYFTTFPDPNSQADYEEPQYAEALYPDYLEAAGPDNNLIQGQSPRTPAYLPQGVGSTNRGGGWIQINAPEGGGGGPYGNYGEERLASHSVTGVSGLPNLANKEQEFGFANKEMIHSGWAPAGRKGRIGYSVKLVSFDTLIKTIITFDEGGQGNISNPPQGDDNLIKIYH